MKAVYTRSRNEIGSAGTLGIPRYLPYTIVKRASPRFPAGAHSRHKLGVLRSNRSQMTHDVQAVYMMTHQFDP